jgi:NTE family protein
MIDLHSHQGHTVGTGGPAGREPAGPPPRLAVVLGAGGVRGIAHIGVLLRLSELGIRPDVVVGTSSGALVGACYAAMGWDPARMMERALSLGPLASLSMLARRRPLEGLAPLWPAGGGWLWEVMDGLKGCDFQTLHHGVRIFGVTCYDLASREELFFSSVTSAARPSLEAAVLGSTALPLLCPSQPVALGGVRMRLIDGGLSRTVPVDRALQPPVGALKTLAVDLGVTTGWNERGLDHQRRLHQRYGGRLLIVKPALGGFGTILMRRGDPRRLIEAGRAAVEAGIGRWAGADAP